ncbi:MAG: transcription termination factor NusA [Algisphaera sp.]
MNGSELLRLIDSISRDRNVDKETLLTDLEQAMVSAARKHFNAEETDDFTCEIDRFNGEINVFRGEEHIPLEDMGRIPAQTAKQVMIQKFREDERASIYDEFIDRVGELVTGQAQRYEGGSLVVQIGRAEGFMPRSEQIPGEQHQPGERVRCLILDVREQKGQVKIVLSRGDPKLIQRLFEVEVPEVAERIIEIRAMAREPGHRTKIAVASVDQKVDAVGACVGVRGSRIRNIVDELGGEKIDIVRWNDSSQLLIQNALKPAEVAEISLCFELGRATVVVPEDQLSLAIGKRGQNVRLAARLTNWDVDILTPVEFTRSLDTLEETLKTVNDIGEDQVDRLAALGVISVFDMEEVGPEYLAETMGIEEAKAIEVIGICGDRAKIVAEEQAKEKIENEARKKAEWEEKQAAMAAGGGGIADLLGGGAGASATPAADTGDSILDMLESRQDDAGAEATDAQTADATDVQAADAEATETVDATDAEPKGDTSDADAPEPGTTPAV